MKKLKVLTTLSVFLFASLAFAPQASATPDGCGDLDNGQLCIRKVDGKWVTSYFRHSGDGSIKVRLGWQEKFSNGYVDSAQYDSPLLSVAAGKDVKYGRKPVKQSDSCIRGNMKHNSDEYVTKWVCP
ncbi:hypothetical protein [Streptomyces sp. NPDC058683]|uniref:hypothetical protein n=1 Tax=Streptomyces sp. NPDC058683 TaxID=3346597 RepID=UPI00365D2C4A